MNFYNSVHCRGANAGGDNQDWEGNAYKIMDLQGPDESRLEGVLHIPPQFVSIKAYCASVAHKANHSFTPNGCFLLFDHPRFGPVPAIQTSKPIERDMEIMVSYDYTMDDAPPSYQELFAKRVLEQYQQSKTWNF